MCWWGVLDIFTLINRDAAARDYYLHVLSLQQPEVRKSETNLTASLFKEENWFLTPANYDGYLRAIVCCCFLLFFRFLFLFFRLFVATWFACFYCFVAFSSKCSDIVLVALLCPNSTFQIPKCRVIIVCTPLISVSKLKVQ